MADHLEILRTESRLSIIRCHIVPAPFDRLTSAYRQIGGRPEHQSMCRIIPPTFIGERGGYGAQPWQWAAESYRIGREPAVRYCVMIVGSCNYSTTAATKGSKLRSAAQY
jgi:hypothetical protein